LFSPFGQIQHQCYGSFYDKILAAVKLPRVFSHPMRAGITDPPPYEGSDHADETSTNVLLW
jgi:hypothetical protein